MNKFRHSILIGIAAIGLCASAFAADGPAASAEHRDHPAFSSEHAAQFAAHRQAQLAKKEAQLHDLLKLLPNQEPGWTSFVAAIAPPPPPDAATRAARHAAMQALTAPERMEKMIEQLKLHETEMAARLAALKTFYATLSPAQQKIFDDNSGLLAPHHGAHPGHPGHGG